MYILYIQEIIVSEKKCFLVYQSKEAELKINESIFKHCLCEVKLEFITFYNN